MSNEYKMLEDYGGYAKGMVIRIVSPDKLTIINEGIKQGKVEIYTEPEPEQAQEPIDITSELKEKEIIEEVYEELVIEPVKKIIKKKKG